MSDIVKCVCVVSFFLCLVFASTEVAILLLLMAAFTGLLMFMD